MFQNVGTQGSKVLTCSSFAAWFWCLFENTGTQFLFNTLPSNSSTYLVYLSHILLISSNYISTVSFAKIKTHSLLTYTHYLSFDHMHTLYCFLHYVFISLSPKHTDVHIRFLSLTHRGNKNGRERGRECQHLFLYKGMLNYPC